MSGNIKTGVMPVTSSSKDTCPTTCPLRGGKGCYAENHWSNIQWDKLSDGKTKSGMSFRELATSITKLPKNTLWRMNEKGDLSHNDGKIDADKLSEIVTANKRKKGFTYTHHLPTVGDNIALIRKANEDGFTINLSANNIDQVDEYMAYGVPVVTLLPMDAPIVSETAGGVKVVVCPEETKGIKCASCGLCQKADRNFVVGFRAHGTRKKAVDIIAKIG